MTTRRAFLTTVAVGTSGVLAGCQIPIIGCQRTNASPPSGTSFSVAWDEGKLLVEYDEGPVIDTSNTGYLEVFVRRKSGGDISGPWFTHQPGPDSEPTPVEPGDTISMGLTPEKNNWRDMRVLWGPASLAPSPRPCEMVVLERWPERPQPP